MHSADNLIARIVSASQVPSERRRQEIVRELRAHIEDFVLIARESGRSEEEVERLVIDNFGDPSEIGRDFAAVYRRERTIQRLSVFVLATLAAGSVITTIVLGLQAGMALSLGVPVARVFGAQHLRMESLYLVCTVAAYFGLLFLEKLFDRQRFLKAVAVLTAAFGVLTLVTLPAEALAAAFISGALLRTLQLFVKRKAWRVGAAACCFGMLGVASACRQWPKIESETIIQLTVWLAVGLCCHMMTVFSRRVDRALSNNLY
jgi:cytochrome bd-type quinol oxidase subunit 2